MRALFCILVLLVSGTVNALASTGLEDLAKEVKKQGSALGRASVLADAISKGVLYVGMPVENLDLLLGLKAGKYEPTNRNVVHVFGLSKTKKTVQLSPGWIFIYVVDDKGAKVIDYELANNSEHSKKVGGSLDALEKSFAKAQNEPERVKVCLKAIDIKQIQVGTPVKNILRILHANDPAKPKSNQRFKQIMLSQDSKEASRPWYFAYTATDNDSIIRTYWLSNVNQPEDGANLLSK